MSTTFPLSTGHLAVDAGRCGGCYSCMLACSLAHEGEENLALSRIHVIQNVFEDYPKDISVAVCRQCAKPACVDACPTGACYVDTAHGNVRVIDESKCNGCLKCLEACPFVPQMTIWNADRNVMVKCDLCINAPYWSESGGPDGKQACVEVCPLKVIKLVKVEPPQKEPVGDVSSGKGV